ncbi:MAG: toll/interleukin-1 receptor domain-containing protein [Anaerolineae bacterium]|nr:toll/interleukin-1 receptor domain-containing protein [Anaerolineae bacterium]
MVNATNADSTQKYDVFISYSRRDTIIAEQIVGKLNARHITVWWDKLIAPGIGTGTLNWVSQIENAIEHARCIVVILSPDSKTSQWVANELAYAQTLDKTAFPLLARGDPHHSIPINLSSAHYIDIRGEHYDIGVEQLIQAVNRLTGKITETQETKVIPPVTPAPSQTTSKTVEPSPRRLYPFIILAIFLIGFLILGLIFLTSSQPQADTTHTLPGTIDYPATIEASVTIGAQTERAITQIPVAIPTTNASVTTIPPINVTPTPNYSATIAARVEAQQTATAEAIVTGASATPTATTTPTSDLTSTPDYPATIAAKVKAVQQTATAKALGTP